MNILVKRLVHEEHGQDIVEYVLLAATISLFILTGVQSFGGQMQALYDELYNRIEALF
jgi:Flp pilus assembly pilin Flp